MTICIIWCWCGFGNGNVYRNKTTKAFREYFAENIYVQVFLHTFQASSSLVQYVLQSTVLAEIRWFAVRKPCPLFNLSISHSCVILLLWLQQIIINNYTANIIKLVLWLPNLCILHLVSYHQTSIKLCTYYFQASR